MRTFFGVLIPKKPKLKDHIISFISSLNNDIDQGKFGTTQDVKLVLLKFMTEIFSYRVRSTSLTTEDAFKPGLEGLFNGIFAFESEEAFSNASALEDSLLGIDSQMMESLAAVFGDVLLNRIKQGHFGDNHEELKEVLMTTLESKIKG